MKRIVLYQLCKKKNKAILQILIPSFMEVRMFISVADPGFRGLGRNPEGKTLYSIQGHSQELSKVGGWGTYLEEETGERSKPCSWGFRGRAVSAPGKILCFYQF